MLPSRGLFRPGPALRLGRQTQQQPIRSSTRQFGTALRGNGLLLRNSVAAQAHGARRTAGSLVGLAASQHLLSGRQARFASTQPSPVAPAATPTPSADPTALPDVSSSSDLSGADLLNVPETIGFLKTLGLDYGWGPTSMMQWYVEHIYVYTGLPWWATLAVLSVSIRAALFFPSLGASAEGQKLSDLRKNPGFESAMKRSMDTTDYTAAMAAQQELKLMRKAVNFKAWKMAVPFLNVPIGYGVFRLVRGMAALPVPSLLDGGMLWFQDLSIPDPLFILPICTSLVMFQAMKITWPYMAPSQQKTMKSMMFVLVPFGTLATLWIPSGLQFFFLMQAALQWLQSAAFYNKRLRPLFGLGPLYPGGVDPSIPKPQPGTWQAPRVLDTTARPAETTTSTPKGAAGVLSSLGVDSVKDKISEYTVKGRKKEEVRKAEALEEQRALQEKEEYLARRDAKMMRRQERR